MNNNERWKRYNAQLLLHAKKANWGLYTNTRFEMAELLRKENKLEDALETLLGIVYLDLNGPENRESIINDPELLKEFPQFDSKTAFLAPGIIERIKEIIGKLNCNEENIMKTFLEHNNKIQRSLKIPLSPKECWGPVKKELKK